MGRTDATRLFSAILSSSSMDNCDWVLFSLEVDSLKSVAYFWSGRLLDFDKAELSIHGMEQTEPPPKQRTSNRPKRLRSHFLHSLSRSPLSASYSSSVSRKGFVRSSLIASWREGLPHMLPISSSCGENYFKEKAELGDQSCYC